MGWDSGEMEEVEQSKVEELKDRREESPHFGFAGCGAPR
jgi:hypothetical protein